MRWSCLSVIILTVTNQPLSLRVHFRFLLVALAITFGAVAQEETPQRRGSRIIDDTTRNIYGPNTSHYYFEDDFFANRNALHKIDTTRWNFHRFSYVQRFDNLYQDLGNIGTAIRPIYNPVSEVIGANTGFDAYDLYWSTETIRYYDTKSPYSNMKLVLGGKGRSMTKVTFSRNITPRWNFGFNYRALLIDKQVMRKGKGDRNIRSTYYDVYSVFHTKDSLYSVFVNYRKNFHQADESGGVKTENRFEFSDFFDDNAQPNLTEAESNDTRSGYHLFHQLKVGRGLQLYHKGDWYKQRNRFKDSPVDSAFYDFTIRGLLTGKDTFLTRDEVNFNTLRNEVGVKGSLAKLFYNGYAAWRNYGMYYQFYDYESFNRNSTGDEFYLGGRMELQADSLITIRGWAEWMMDDRYQIQGSIKTKWFEASAKRSVSKPTFLQQAYLGSHDFWINNFSNVEGTEVKGNLIYQSQRLGVYPGVKFTTFRNYIFFKEDPASSGQKVLPIQSSGYQTWVTPELNFSIWFTKHINFNSQILYTKVLENSEDAIQVPDVFVNTQLCYTSIWFRDNLDFQAGVDIHWNKAYYAQAYDPAIQQFYVQQHFLIPEVAVVDLFLNAKIRRARIVVKYNNVLMMFNDYGNIPTPYYPGIRNIIDFGFDWSFYD